MRYGTCFRCRYTRCSSIVRGNVVGYECETQDGMHLRADYAAGLLFGNVEWKLCECGRPGPRLMPPQQAIEAVPSARGVPVSR